MAGGIRTLFLTHRYLGIALCLLFVLWFVSGIAMLYVRMPILYIVLSISVCVSVSMINMPSSWPFSCPSNTPLSFQTDVLPAHSEPSHSPTQFAIKIVIEYRAAMSDNAL